MKIVSRWLGAGLAGSKKHKLVCQAPSPNTLKTRKIRSLIQRQALGRSKRWKKAPANVGLRWKLSLHQTICLKPYCSLTTASSLHKCYIYFRLDFILRPLFLLLTISVSFFPTSNFISELFPISARGGEDPNWILTGPQFPNSFALPVSP